MGVKFNPFTGNLDLIDTTAAAGADTQVQYNNGGSLAGSADFTWDDTAKELGVGGDINLDDGGTYATTLQLITPTANRTISFPDATGTVALVGGSSGQLIYNAAGAYAGDGNLTWDATTGLTLGRKVLVNEQSGFSGDLLDLQVAGSSKLGFIGNTYLRLGSGTGGIQFNGDTASANALDDYEEGTWTPGVINSSDTDISADFVVRTGSYTKIGNCVNFSAVLYTGSSAGTRTIKKITGLPFTIPNENAKQYAVSIGNGGGGTTADTTALPYIEKNTTEIRIKNPFTIDYFQSLIMFSGHFNI